MNIKSFFLLILITAFFSCTEQSEDNKIDIINNFVNTYNTYGEDSLIRFYHDTTEFIDAVEPDTELILKSYEDLYDNMHFNEMGLHKSDHLKFNIDSVSGEQDLFKVYQSYENLFFKEMGYTQLRIVSQFLFQNGKIKEIVLSDVIDFEDIKKDYDSFRIWYYHFFPVEEFPFEDLWNGNSDVEYIKTSANTYKDFKEFESQLEHDYLTTMSLDELAHASFLNNDYHGQYFRFRMSFKEYEESEQEPEDDFEDFSSYALFSSEGSDLYTIPENRNFKEISVLKEGTPCYIYGRVTKFLTGELALEDVVVYSLK